MTIRAMESSDAGEVLEMMRVFYASPAVSSDGSDEIFENDIACCVGDCPYLEGVVFTDGAALAGYAMIAKSFSTEFGKPCVWIEDLYVRPEYRNRGIGKEFFSYAQRRFPGCVMRLEVERENRGAVHLYRKSGFEILPYMEMKKEL